MDLSATRGGFETFRSAAAALLAGREIPTLENAIAATEKPLRI